MKKLFSVFVIQFVVLNMIFGAPIDSTKGYGKLYWGSTVEDAKKAGYKLTPLNSDSDKTYLSKLYTDKVEGYSVKAKDNMVSALQLHYYYGRLVSAIEMLNLKEYDLKILESRYGKFSEKRIYPMNGQYMDAKIAADGSISLSITIGLAEGFVCVNMFDWNVYKNISIVGSSLKGNDANSIVDEFSSVAVKLIQEKSDGTKASYAFLPLTTDYNNTLVDNYITDALTEAMFNTGKVKIIERSNLEAILKEQKFQASGLVNEETAKSIGMIAGVDFVCYGTLKDIGSGFTANIRVVDVETGEICAMARDNIEKDSYLKEQEQGPRGTKTISKKQNTITSKKTVKTSTDNLWQVSSYRNSFDGFTSYTFTVKAATGEMFYVGYKKCDIETNSRVFAGIYWVESWRFNRGDSPDGTYDFKLENGSVINKTFNDRWTNYIDLSEKNFFMFGWNSKEGARWWLDMLTQNNIITVRKRKLVRKFQTAGLLDKMAEVGISWEEIDAAMSNEEF
ncbi:MAG: hypothetical protein IIW71_04980 [Treponema sp.]|nr:hypothetical protein [Treponema sp.]